MSLTRRQIVAAALAAPLSRADAAEPDGFHTLEARPGALRLLPEPAAETAVWGIDGRVPGPVLRAKKGVECRARLLNSLPQSTALHFQGLRGPNAMDGAVGLTQAAVAPGQSFDFRFTPPDSGFYWYRPSALPNAAEQKARGLYGLLIVDEAEPPVVDLDLPVVVDDWRLDESGAILGPFPDPAATAGDGRIGDLVTVNSSPAPLAVEQRPGARVRLRLLNACSARMMAVRFDVPRPLVMAIDGQNCEPFEPARGLLPIGPGARFEIMFDLPATANTVSAIRLRGVGLRADAGDAPDRDLLIFQTKGDLVPARAAIAGLGLNPLLPAEIHLERARRLDIVIEGPTKDPARVWTLNGGAGAIGARPLLSVARNQPVALGFINKTPVAHSLQVHGHVMRVLHLLDDGWEPYWRDAIIVPPGKTARVAFLADNPGKWLIESTIFAHAASGARAWFEVA